MHEIQRLIESAKRIEVAIVLFRDDFYESEMRPELRLGLGIEGDCWQVIPKPGWTVSADSQGNMSALGTENYEAPRGWRYLATMALLLTPESHAKDGICSGRSVWFPMAGVIPTPNIEKFLSFICEEMPRRAEFKGAIATGNEDSGRKDDVNESATPA